MKRDDIIKQKLFEAYKLSEFYLNLIIDDNYNTNNFKKGTQEETPFQLSKSFSTKLYQIITRYDSLLEQNEFEQKAPVISTPTSTLIKKSMKSNYMVSSDDEDDYDYYITNKRSLTKNDISSITVKLNQKRQQQQKITKSFSNLSKDSGIMFDISHNSSSDSNITTSFISEQLNDEDDEDCYSEENNNAFETSSTSTLNLMSNNEDDDMLMTNANNDDDLFKWHSTSNFLCYDNDSLMNVSMIDNIEAVYKNSDKNDSMCSSILTFI